MDLRWSDAENAWREEVRAFLPAELPAAKAFDHEFCEDDELWAFTFEFTKKVGAHGWIGLTWPEEYGGLGRPRIEQLIMSEEFIYNDAPMVNLIGLTLAGGTLLMGGTEEQKRRFLGEIPRFDRFWAEGLTEPDAGSDLAAMRTTAVRDGDDWILNGQKTFTTWGDRADSLYVAARTDPSGTKHHGLSIFCVEIDLPGVSMSPLFNLGGGRQNHTFFDDVRVPGDMLIGQEGQGWSYIMNAFYTSGGAHAGYMRFQKRLDDVVAYCKTTTRNNRLLIDDPIVRAQLAELARLVEVDRLLTYEAIGDAATTHAPAFGGTLHTVVAKEAMPRFADLCNQIVGPTCVLKSGSRWAPLQGNIETWYRQSYANHAGGTSQVKRMVLATRGLGLPR